MSTRTVLAAVDNGPSARPVLAVGTAFATLLDAWLEAVHVREDGHPTADRAAADAGVPLHVVEGEPTEAIVDVIAGRDVDALVLGLRKIRGGKRPSGHVARVVMKARPDLRYVLVPPEVTPAYELHRVLVPLEGTAETSDALRSVVELAGASDLDVVALHVLTPETVPPFRDAPQHEDTAWVEEFKARYCPGLRLDVRYGVPGGETLAVVGDIGADLVALSWSGSLDEGRALTVREALEHSRVPVLLVPAAHARSLPGVKAAP